MTRTKPTAAEFESVLRKAAARGNKTAAECLEWLQQCECDGEKVNVMEDLLDDALRFHGFMIEVAKWMERKYLPNEKQTWRLR